MFKTTVVISILAAFLSYANASPANDIPITIPPPGMPDGSFICGTMIVLNVIDLEDFPDQEVRRPLTISEDPPGVGDRQHFYVVNFEESGSNTEYDNIEFELRAISDKSEIWVEVDEMADEKINEEVVEDILKELDEKTAEYSWNPDLGIIDIGRQLFGDPPDFEGSGRLKTLLTDIQDGWDPDQGGGFIAGYFNPGDQLPRMVNPNSNEADIIYINTYPGIYNDDVSPDASRRFGTLAHEYQHLIHHSYGNLNTFQNEGQSEFAELIKGYDARTMRWLEQPEEIDGTVEVDGGPEGLYRWRRNSSNVLLDYQRAQLLHGYVYERTDAEHAGSITRASFDGKSAYVEALDEFDIAWEEFLRDFQITNRINNPAIDDGRYAYTLPQLLDTRASGIGAKYDPVKEAYSATESSEGSEAEVMYGGGYYSLFENPENLSIELNGDDYIAWGAILVNDDTGDDVILLEEGSHKMDGIYDEIVLVGANTREQGINEETPGSRHYNYTYEYGTVDSYFFGSVPEEFKLYNAFPNPFNPATQIRYTIPEEVYVRIDVYNNIGQRVATIADETKTPGRYEETFNASGLSSGVYMYRIQAGDFVRTRKMTLIK